MLLGVWADQAGVFLAWLCAITTVVFAVPITFFPLRWARLMRWRIPAETQLTVYFGRCLGLFILILEGLMARAAWAVVVWWSRAMRPAMPPWRDNRVAPKWSAKVSIPRGVPCSRSLQQAA